jgi:hypothetical protein
MDKRSNNGVVPFLRHIRYPVNGLARIGTDWHRLLASPSVGSAELAPSKNGWAWAGFRSASSQRSP